MRINIYVEEIFPVIDSEGERVLLVTKQVVAKLPNRHKAIQLLLGERAIHTNNSDGKDDDTSAVTFWYYSEYERLSLVSMLEMALEKLKSQKRGASEKGTYATRCGPVLVKRSFTQIYWLSLSGGVTRRKIVNPG